MSVAKENLRDEQVCLKSLHLAPTFAVFSRRKRQTAPYLQVITSPETPVQRDLLVKKNVVKASFWAVLCHYGNVWHFNAATNKFAQVGVIELPGRRDRESKQHNPRRHKVTSDRGMCSLPDLFHFLSDGFGQRESLCLNPLDGHRPAVTGGES